MNDPEKSRRVGIIQMNFGALANALHLPEGHSVRAIRSIDAFSETFELLIEGPWFPPVDEWCQPPVVSYSVTKTVLEDTFEGKFG